MSLIQKIIFKKCYTFKNTICKHKLREYINWIIHNSKSANLLVYNQFIAIRDDIAVKLWQFIFIIMKNIYVSDIFNIINNVKTDWWALKAKFIWDNNKDHQHPEQPNQKSAEKENQTIFGCQSSCSYSTYSLNLNTDNYKFSMNFFNSMFFITLYSIKFPFVYLQSTQIYQYLQTGNERWQHLALLIPPERKVIEPPPNQGNQGRNVKNICQPLRNLLNPLPDPMVYPWYGQTAQNQQQAEPYCQFQPGQYLLYQNHYFSNQHQYGYPGQILNNTGPPLAPGYFGTPLSITPFMIFIIMNMTLIFKILFNMITIMLYYNNC